MLNFDALARAFENTVAQIACPACQGPIEMRVGDMAPGEVARCGACDFQATLQAQSSTEELLTAIKGDVAHAFKRAFKAIEGYTAPPT